MLELFKVITKIASTDASVLIRGETGTGKELVARAIHNLSPRQKGPFQALNCATLSSELMLSELFGHVKGAYTGASSSRAGLFELAHRGTVFLDEIAEIPVDIQARLLRVLQERLVTPVGSHQTRKVDVRLLAATHKSLRQEVAIGRFREDLMYRVRVIPIFLPPLRERVGDVKILIWQFLDEFHLQGYRAITGITKSALDAFLSYSWPGNIRELRNAIEYALVMGEGDLIALPHLNQDLLRAPSDLELRSPSETNQQMSVVQNLDKKRLGEKPLILKALERNRWHMQKTAEELGITRSTLWRWMRRLGIAIA
jgi:two-component system response regulator AtoC